MWRRHRCGPKHLFGGGITRLDRYAEGGRRVVDGADAEVEPTTFGYDNAERQRLRRAADKRFAVDLAQALPADA